MYNTKNATVAATKATKVYQTLLALYPYAYHKRFGHEMQIVFHDLYQEELAKRGSVGVHFWFSVLGDVVQSAASEHIAMMKKQGIKNYFHIRTSNVIGAVLLIPFLTLLGLDLLGRVVQGDLTHYNRAWYQAITHSVLYREPILIQVIFIFAPLLAVALNVVSLLSSLRTTKKPMIPALILTNPLSVIVTALGLFCLMVVYGHDVFPCMVHGIFSHGFGSFFKLVAVCGNA